MVPRPVPRSGAVRGAAASGGDSIVGDEGPACCETRVCPLCWIVGVRAGPGMKRSVSLGLLASCRASAAAAAPDSGVGLVGCLLSANGFSAEALPVLSQVPPEGYAAPGPDG